MARPPGGLITSFRIKLINFNEAVLQFDHFHIELQGFSEKYQDFIINSNGFSEIVLKCVCPLIECDRFSGTIP